MAADSTETVTIPQEFVGQEDVVVWVNFDRTVIARGEETEVSEAAYAVLLSSGIVTADED